MTQSHHRVGATLGAGSSKRALTAAAAACAATPLLWLVVAGLLLEPHSQVRAVQSMLLCEIESKLEM